MTVGQRLKIARKMAGISGESLGEAIGVSKGQISNIERGTSDLTKSNALVFCEKLGIRLNWLLTGEGEMKEGSGQGNTVTQGRVKQGDNSYAGSGNQNNPVFTPAPAADSQVAVLEEKIKGKEELLSERERLLEERQKLLDSKEETIQQLKFTIDLLKPKS